MCFEIEMDMHTRIIKSSFFYFKLTATDEIKSARRVAKIYDKFM